MGLPCLLSTHYAEPLQATYSSLNSYQATPPWCFKDGLIDQPRVLRSVYLLHGLACSGCWGLRKCRVRSTDDQISPATSECRASADDVVHSRYQWRACPVAGLVMPSNCRVCKQIRLLGSDVISRSHVPASSCTFVCRHDHDCSF